MSTVLTMGTFDLYHIGHLNLFKACRKIAGEDGRVIVTVNSDEFISRFKGKAPIQSLEERMHMVGSCKYVDDVYSNWGDENAAEVISDYMPGFLVIGSDWAPPKDYLAQLNITEDFLLDNDITLLYLHRAGTASSTELKERVRNA